MAVSCREPMVLCQTRGTLFLPIFDSLSAWERAIGWRRRVCEATDVVLMKTGSSTYHLRTCRQGPDGAESGGINMCLNKISKYKIQLEKWHEITHSSGRMFALKFAKCSQFEPFLRHLEAVLTTVGKLEYSVEADRESIYQSIIIMEPQRAASDRGDNRPPPPSPGGRRPPPPPPDCHKTTDTILRGFRGEAQIQSPEQDSTFNVSALATFLQEAVALGKANEAAHWARQLALKKVNIYFYCGTKLSKDVLEEPGRSASSRTIDDVDSFKNAEDEIWVLLGGASVQREKSEC